MHKSTFFLFVVAVSMSIAACPKSPNGKPTMSKPPVAEKIPYTHEYHGQKVEDPYYWLRERDNPKVLEYLKAENAYTKQALAHTEALQKTLYDEMLSRIKETDDSVPYPKRGYFYYSKTLEGKNYPIYARKKGSLEAEEEVLLDVNALAEGKEYTEVTNFEVSPNSKLLAYAVDEEGDERYTLYFKNIATGTVSQETVPRTTYGIAWANDNRTVYYVLPDDANRPYKVMRHTLGTDASKDELVYEEKDEKFHLAVWSSKSSQYVYIKAGSAVTEETWLIDANDPQAEPKVFAKRKQDTEYSVAHHGDRFFVLTNDDAQNFRIMEAAEGRTERKYWQEVIPHREDAYIQDMDIFKDFLVLEERVNGLPTLRVRDLKTAKDHYVEFAEASYYTSLSVNEEYDTHTLRFTYTSFTTPRSVFDYDMVDKTRELKKEQPVLGGYDRTQYVTERVFAKASDGTEIPVSLVYKQGRPKDGSKPALLIGYGSYGYSYDVYFSSNRLSLLDRGFVIAIAHIRGGAEMGRGWYEDGKYLHKKNTFTDFIAAAEYLIENDYTSSERLAIQGGSAGGLLMGAVVNMRPELFQCVVAHVPFVDVINTMMDETIPLTVIEWEEWGNPNDKEYYDYMKSYSPYDNVTAQDYPHMLITAGLNDPRVQYWEPAKWTAKLRALKTDDNLLVLKTNMGAGHGGASGRYDYLKEVALDYAFILDRLSLADAPTAHTAQK